MFDIAHGAGLAILIPAWMKFVIKHDTEKMARLAEKVFFVDRDYYNPERTALEGIFRLEQHFRRMGMAVRLSEAE